MALLIGDNFNYQANKPNFERDSFATLESMRTYPETSIDEGHISYCEETDKHYKFLSSNPVDTITGKWREFKTGASFPEGGTAGQVLKKTSSGVEWGTDEKGFELPLGGSNGQVLKKSGNTAIWQNDNDTTYENATQLIAGLMSAEDKTKLDNISTAYASIVTQAEYDSIDLKEANRIYYIKG